MISPKDLTIVVQGPVDPTQTPDCLRSIRSVFPVSSVILSTWEGADLNSVDSFGANVLLNEDPGFRPRGAEPESKPNNVNRQIVSARNGVNAAKTKYTLKMRTDFLLKSDGFLGEFERYGKFEEQYRVFQQRVVVCMFGTRKAKGRYFNLPFHVSDFCSFGLTQDLQNLYNIPLVTEEEFNYFNIHTEIKPDTFAVNRYNAEQSIIIKFLRKNGRHIDCQYSTDISKETISSSYHYIVNNFLPLSFKRYGVLPLKEHLLPGNNIEKYCDYITYYEWLVMYKEFCDTQLEIIITDEERKRIDTTNQKMAILRKVKSRACKVLPILNKMFSIMLEKLERHIRINFGKAF